MAEAASLLEVDGIETFYGLSQVLFGLSLSIRKGEMVDIFVDHQDRLPAAFQHRQTVPDLLADQRREPLGRLVQD